MRVIVHGTLAQVTAITPGVLVLQVTSVSEPYPNRKGTPRLHRVYLQAEITSQPAPAPAPTAPAAAPAPKPPRTNSGVPLEIPEGGEAR